MKKKNKRQIVWTLYQELFSSFFLKIFPFLIVKQKPLALGFNQEDILKTLKQKKPYAWIELKEEEVSFLFEQTLLQYKVKKNLSNASRNALKDLGFTPLTEKNTRFLNKQYVKEFMRTDYLVHSFSLHRPFIVDHYLPDVKGVTPLSKDELSAVIEEKKVIILSLQYEKILSKIHTLEDKQFMQKINKTTCLRLPMFEDEQWFDRLDLLKVEVMKQDFDLILLDMGLFNSHLAWFVKSMNRQAMVLDLAKIFQLN
jgi:hypothetical protein